MPHEGEFMWQPQVGDLVGVKKVDLKGIVLESRGIALTARLFGTFDGAATVLVEGDKRVYSWSDLYPIQLDEDDPEG